MRNIIDIDDYNLVLDNLAKINIDWNKFNDKIILITGACGLVGSFLIDALMYKNKIDDMNITLYALGREENKIKDRFHEYLENKSFNYIIQDVVKQMDVSIRFDYIVHCASGASPKLYSTNPVEIMTANFIGMLNILEYSKKNNCGKIYYVSSGEVYGDNHNNDHKIDENDEATIVLNSVRNCYPDSKRATETLCKSYASEYGLDIVIGRFSHIYGPTYTAKDDKAIAQFFNKAVNKENIVLKSNGVQVRSYCYVADAVSAILYQLLYGKTGEAYNVSNDDCFVSIASLAKLIAEQANVEITFDVPTEDEKNGYTPILETNMSSKKLQELGWRPMYTLKEGISNTLDVRGKLNEK